MVKQRTHSEDKDRKGIFPLLAGLSSVEASARYGITHDYVANLCRKGLVNGALIGRQWFVDEPSLVVYLESARVEREKRRAHLSEKLRQEYHSRIGAAEATQPLPPIQADLSVERLYIAPKGSVSGGEDQGSSSMLFPPLHSARSKFIYAGTFLYVGFALALLFGSVLPGVPVRSGQGALTASVHMGAPTLSMISKENITAIASGAAIVLEAAADTSGDMAEWAYPIVHAVAGAFVQLGSTNANGATELAAVGSSAVRALGDNPPFDGSLYSALFRSIGWSDPREGLPVAGAVFKEMKETYCQSPVASVAAYTWPLPLPFICGTASSL